MVKKKQAGPFRFRAECRIEANSLVILSATKGYVRPTKRGETATHIVYDWAESGANVDAYPLTSADTHICRASGRIGPGDYVKATGRGRVTREPLADTRTVDTVGVAAYGGAKRGGELLYVMVL